jgi:excisionase family DNA binding protein
MEIAVSEAAARMGVSPRRVRERIARGDLPARRVGRIWVVDEVQLARSDRLGRPMSERVAWAFLDLLGGGKGVGVSQPEQSRLRDKCDRLRLAGDDAASLLRSWLRNRARAMRYSAAPADLGDLRQDGRVVLSGVSDARSGKAAAAVVEGYIDDAALPALMDDFLLSVEGNHNVILHVLHGRDVPDPVPLPLLLADLADHDSPRESAAVARLVGELPWRL